MDTEKHGFFLLLCLMFLAGSKKTFIPNSSFGARKNSENLPAKNRFVKPSKKSERATRKLSPSSRNNGNGSDKVSYGFLAHGSTRKNTDCLPAKTPFGQSVRRFFATIKDKHTRICCRGNGFLDFSVMKKTLLLTGARGFVGRNAISELREHYLVSALGRGTDNDVAADLAAGVPALPRRFDVVFHAAGRAHCVPRTPADANEFFAVNVAGTRNLCLALEKVGVPASLIFVSTVAVYGLERGENISENAPLAGTSPYARSKIEAENFLREWCSRHGVVLTILRPSLIAGADAPGNLGAMVRGLRSGRYFRIGRGNARKSIVMARDLGRVVPLAETRGGVFNLCATHAPSFAELEKLITTQLGKREPRALPYAIAKCLAAIGDCCFGRAPIDSARLRKITETLTFSNRKAREALGWTPLEILENYRVSYTPPQ